MNRSLVILLSLATSSLFALDEAPSGTAADNAADVEAIKKVIMSGAEAWNQQDLASYGASLAEEVDFINVRGGWTKGKAETMQGHERILQTVIKNSYLKVEVLKVRFLKPDVALAYGTVEMFSRTPEGGPGEALQKNMMSQVLTKDAGGQWLITGFQNTKVDASFGPPPK